MDIMPIIETLWPLVASAAILRVLGNTSKKFAGPPDSTWYWKLFWRTLPLHPIVLGVLFGATDIAPVPAWVGNMGEDAGMLFYGFSGYVALHYHAMIRTWKKYKKEE